MKNKRKNTNDLSIQQNEQKEQDNYLDLDEIQNETTESDHNFITRKKKITAHET